MKCIPTTGKIEPEGSLIEDAGIAGILKEAGDTLRHIRVAQRIQMVDLAEMGNMSSDVLSRIERCVRMDRSVRQLYVITGLLAVRLSDVLRSSELWAMENKIHGHGTDRTVRLWKQFSERLRPWRSKIHCWSTTQCFADAGKPVVRPRPRVLGP